MPKGHYTPIPDATAAQMRRLYEEGATTTHIAEQFGYSPQGVRNAITRAGGTIRSVTESNKIIGRARHGKATVRETDAESRVGIRRAVLLILTAAPKPFATLDDFMAEYRADPDNRTRGRHEVTHVLHALKQDGLVAFKENKSRAQSSANAWLEDIRATRAGYETVGIQPPVREMGRGNGQHTEQAQHRTDMTDYRNHPARAVGGPITREHLAREAATEAAPEPETPTEPVATPAGQEDATEAVPEAFPLLAALQARADQIVQAAQAAERFMEAALLLEAVDKEEAERLARRASEIIGPSLSPLEAEYLRFARSRA